MIDSQSLWIQELAGNYKKKVGAACRLGGVTSPQRHPILIHTSLASGELAGIKEMFFMHAGSVREQLRQFVCIFDDQEIIEIRLLRATVDGETESKSRWTTASRLHEEIDWLLQENALGWNVFVGVNARGSIGGKKDETVTTARIVFADFDGGISLTQVRLKLLENRLPTPSLLVCSGHGFHCYWLLEKPTQEMPRWRQLQKGIARLLGSDSKVCNPSRVMRLPGFINHKSPKAEAYMVECDSSLQYDLNDIDSLLPDESTLSTATIGNAPSDSDPQVIEKRAIAYLGTCDPSISGQRGHDKAFAAARAVVYGFDLGVERGLQLLLAHFNPSCQPPWSESDLRHKCEEADKVPFEKRRGWLISEGSRERSNHGSKVGNASSDEQNVNASTDHDSDIANGRRLAQLHRQDMIHVPERKKWYVWEDGKHWALDVTGQVDRFAKADSDKQLEEAERESDSKRRRERIKLATHSRSFPRLRAAINVASTEHGIPHLISELNQHPFLFNVDNGTLDLTNGTLRLHRREDMLTQLCTVTYDSKAECPLWHAFLHYAMAEKQELIEYLQRAVGYTLTGSVGEQCLFFSYGTGANGKSVFSNTLQMVLGMDYAIQSNPELLTVSQTPRHPTELADLFGRRFVAINETEQDCKLAEARVKQLTGGDFVRARGMKEDFWQFAPTHKIWLAGNHKPSITGQDYGIWRRIHLIPWLVTVPPEKQDKELSAKLLTEVPGILAWAVQGCLEWQRQGLNPPQEIIEAVKEYRLEQDNLENFLRERCARGSEYTVRAGILKKAYDDYISPTKSLSHKQFASAMLAKGLKSQEEKSSGCQVYQGITIAS